MKASASDDFQNIHDLILLDPNQVFERALPDLTNLNWQVGDIQERQVKKGAIRGGTVKSWVDRNEGRAFWLVSEVKIIFKPKKIVEMLVNRRNGHILRYIEDGEEKEAPDVTNIRDCQEISESTEQVSVPAGQYNTVKSIIQCNDKLIAFWVNNRQVNMGGHIQQAVLKSLDKPDSYKYLIELTRWGRL